MAYNIQQHHVVMFRNCDVSFVIVLASQPQPLVWVPNIVTVYFPLIQPYLKILRIFSLFFFKCFSCLIIACCIIYDKIILFFLHGIQEYVVFTVAYAIYI